MTPSDLEHVPHRRLNPLTRQWVLVSPQRNERPWLGKVEASHEQAKLSWLSVKWRTGVLR
ncbi:MAG: hypothetical protein WAN38_08140, partial [Terriglobales bacterium]